MNNNNITPRQLERCTRLYKVVFPEVLEKERLLGRVDLNQYGSDCNTPLCILGYAAMDNVFVAEGLYMNSTPTGGVVVRFGRDGLPASNFFNSEITFHLNLFGSFDCHRFKTQRDDILDRQRRLKEFLIDNEVEL